MPDGVIVVDPAAVYTAAGLAQLLDLQVQTVYNLRSTGGSLPPGVLIRGRLFFPGPGVHEWMTTGDPPPLRGPKLTAADVIEIRRSLARGERQRDVAERHGVSAATISHIARGRSWRRVP